MKIHKIVGCIKPVFRFMQVIFLYISVLTVLYGLVMSDARVTYYVCLSNTAFRGVITSVV